MKGGWWKKSGRLFGLWRRQGGPARLLWLSHQTVKPESHSPDSVRWVRVCYWKPSGFDRKIFAFQLKSLERPKKSSPSGFAPHFLLLPLPPQSPQRASQTPRRQQGPPRQTPNLFPKIGSPSTHIFQQSLHILTF